MLKDNNVDLKNSCLLYVFAELVNLFGHIRKETEGSILVNSAYVCTNVGKSHLDNYSECLR